MSSTLMEVPDPVPEMVVSLPRRGKIRVASVEEADALIVAATRAKRAIIAALGTLRPADAEPEPLQYSQCPAEWTPGQRCDRYAGHGGIHHSEAGFEWDEEPELARTAPGDEGKYCGLLEGGDGYLRFCALAPGHGGRHVNADHDVISEAQRLPVPASHYCDSGNCEVCGDGTGDGLEAPRPAHHWNHGEDACHDQDEDENNEIWLCTAQRGHAGPDHIAYGDDGEPVRTWPVAFETRMACGDSLADAAPYGEGAPMWCPRHGETAAITQEQWLTEGFAEPETFPAGSAVEGEGGCLTLDQDAPPAPAGTPFPARSGYVTGLCGHAVAGSEWNAGFRTCERCVSGEADAPDLAAEAADVAAAKRGGGRM